MAKRSLLPRLRRIRMILLDVDGVLTDGRIVYGNDGTEYKAFDAHDGYGIERAMKHGLLVGLISGRKSPVVERRAKELGIVDVFQNFMNKVAAMEELKRKYDLSDDRFAYIGDDVFDMPLLERVGFSAAPHDALPEVVRSVHYRANAEGGRGAVREMIDMILKAQGKV